MEVTLPPEPAIGDILSASPVGSTSGASATESDATAVNEGETATSVAQTQAPSVVGTTTADVAAATQGTAAVGNAQDSSKSAVSNVSSVPTCPEVKHFSCVEEQRCRTTGMELSSLTCGSAGLVCCLKVSHVFGSVFFSPST